jgi:hypothetical protein
VDPIGWNRATPLGVEYGEDTYVLTTVHEDSEGYRPETTKKRPTTPMAIFGTHNIERIVAQRGTFFIWGRETKAMINFEQRMLDHLWKLRLMDDKLVLRSNLQALGFTESMVFPDLQNLAVELVRIEGWH